LQVAGVTSRVSQGVDIKGERRIMKTILLVNVSFLIVAHAASADEISRAKLVLVSPREYQVFQRRSLREGYVTVAGSLSFVKIGERLLLPATDG
jgi:hypothetical protein